MGVPFTDRNFKVTKRIFFLFLLATFSLNLFCQQDSVIVRDSTYSYYWDSGTNEWVYGSKEVSYWSELTTSIPNSIIDLNYIVYPNPFTDYTTIKLSDAVQTEKIDLIDIHGRTVRSIDNVNSNSVTIHRDNLPSGIYFIRIHSDDTYVQKVIIR